MADGRFTFNFTKAVQDQFAAQIEAQPERALSDPQAPREPGVYVLYRNSKVVYVGSAVGPAKLHNRLRDHANRIRKAQNISLKEMTCRFMTVDEDWMAIAAEWLMIGLYKPEWNRSGFGGHEPGGGRPGTRPRRWDADFPLKQKALWDTLPRWSTPGKKRKPESTGNAE